MVLSRGGGRRLVAPLSKHYTILEQLSEGEPEEKEEEEGILTFEIEFLASSGDGILKFIFIRFENNLKSNNF